mgnify:CR=1 FL=1
MSSDQPSSPALRKGCGKPVNPVFALVSIALCLSCNSPVTYIIEGGPGALVIAEHMRRVSVITETHDTLLRLEVVTSGTDGKFTLNHPLVLYGDDETRLVLSRAGYRAWDGTTYRDRRGGGSKVGGAFRLARARNFAEEYQAVGTVADRIERLCRSNEVSQCPLLRQHLEERESHLRSAYPYAHESQSALWPRIAGPFRVVVSSWAAYRQRENVYLVSDLSDLLQMGQGRLLVAETGSPPHVVLLDGDGEVLVDRPSDPGLGGRRLLLARIPASWASSPDDARLGTESVARVAALGVSEIHLLDEKLRLRERVPLQPPLREDDWRASLQVVPGRGFLIGVTSAASGSHVVLYHRDGTFAAERGVPDLALRQAAMLADGRLVVAGTVSDRSPCELSIARGTVRTLRSCDGRVLLLPGLLERTAEDEARPDPTEERSAVPAPTELLRGADSFALDGEQIHVIVTDLLPATSEDKGERSVAWIALEARGAVRRSRLLDPRLLGPLRVGAMDAYQGSLAVLNRELAASDLIELR